MSNAQTTRTRTLNQIASELRLLASHTGRAGSALINDVTYAGRLLIESLEWNVFCGPEHLRLRHNMEMSLSRQQMYQLGQARGGEIVPPLPWHVFVNAYSLLNRERGGSEQKFGEHMLIEGAPLFAKLIEAAAKESGTESGQTASDLPKTVQINWSYYELAIERNPALKHSTDKEVFEWLRGSLELDERVHLAPNRESFCRYLRQHRNATGSQKNKPRGGRIGHSVVTIEELEPSALHSGSVEAD